MKWHITQAEYLKDYRLRLTFKDGLVKDVDLKDELWGPVFQPLKNLEEFKKFRVDPEMDTIAWENGADFSPRALYEMGKKVDPNENHLP